MTKKLEKVLKDINQVTSADDFLKLVDACKNRLPNYESWDTFAWQQINQEILNTHKILAYLLLLDPEWRKKSPIFFDEQKKWIEKISEKISEEAWRLEPYTKRLREMMKYAYRADKSYESFNLKEHKKYSKSAMK